jgi:DNA-3-methyladenine glycosylase
VSRAKVLPRSFYGREDPVEAAIDLLGKILRVDTGKGICAARIVEAEAYGGPKDRASHAWRGRTPRNESMFGKPGTAYVYLCYGIHRMFNVVTAPENIPAAVLIRGVEPLQGHELMARRRKLDPEDRRLTAGPGALTAALGIRIEWDRTDLVCGPIRIEDDGVRISHAQILRRPRVGVNYAGPAAKFRWRFSIRDNPWVSPART